MINTPDSDVRAKNPLRVLPEITCKHLTLKEAF